MNPRHLQNSAEHATPTDIVEAARAVLGRIDVDPATTEEINRRNVRALKFYTAEDPGLSQNWPGSVFLNPPGGCPVLATDFAASGRHMLRAGCGNSATNKTPACSCHMVRKFWEHLIAQHLAGITHAAIWVGFSLEQLQVLQRCEMDPRDFPVCIPRKRVAYLAPGDEFKAQKSPPHSSYITYLGPSRQKFAEVFSQFGKVRL